MIYKYILVNIFLVIAFIYFHNKLNNGYHMLQLESYKNKRYLKWIKNNKTILIRDIILLPIILIGLIKNQNVSIIILIVYLIFLYIFKPKYTQKKPLVKTPRIKRMYATEFIIIGILFVIANIYINNLDIITLIIILLIVSYYEVLIINIINSPIEKKIQNKYYKLAKRKLTLRPDLKVIGITGSYGKTSTKYILNEILRQKYNTLITPESYNTIMGVVRTINEKLNNTHQIFICEMGAKNIGDIKEICNLVCPKYGVLTAIGPQHIETFKTLENVKNTKLELIKSLPREGIAFVNYDDENIKSINFENKTIRFGTSKDCEYFVENVKTGELGSSFDICNKNSNKIVNVRTKLLGMHNVTNITGAVAIAYELGLNDEEIKTGIRFLKPVTHRLELKTNPNGSVIIDDAYNSNPKGAKMALDVLKNFSGKKRILITPGMVDLGEKSFEYNKNFGKQATKGCDYIILVGEKQAIPILEGIKEENYDIQNKLFIAKNLNEAITKMNSIINECSVVLFENDLPDNYL